MVHTLPEVGHSMYFLPDQSFERTSIGGLGAFVTKPIPSLDHSSLDHAREIFQSVSYVYSKSSDAMQRNTTLTNPMPCYSIPGVSMPPIVF